MASELPTHDTQLWTNVTATGAIKKHSPVKYWFEAQERWGDDISRLSQFLLRPGLGYQLTENTSLWLGYAWVYTSWPFAVNPHDENRLWQQLLWAKTYATTKWMARSRLEERFISTNYHTAWRFRQLAKLTVPIDSSRYSLVGSEEVFIHLNDFNHQKNQGFDQNRYFLGIGYALTRSLSTEIGYLNQYIRRINAPSYSGNCFSITVFLTN